MGKGSAPRPYSVDTDTFESNWDKIFKKEGINLTEEELANVLIIEDIVKHHRKKQNSDDVSPHTYEYELNKSTGDVEKRFKDGIWKPNSEQFDSIKDD
jgi:hypothetical protein